jgi:alpha-L-rhamnosidase
MLQRGATTLWEEWPYQDNSPSHNHPMFGSVSEWFYRSVGGINPAEDAVGFDKIVIAPKTIDDLDWAKTEYNSIRGRIATDWRKDGGRLKLHVVIPANTAARVYVPTADPASVTEGGRPAGEAEGVRAAGAEGKAAVFEVGGGTYSFESDL